MCTCLAVYEKLVECVLSHDAHYAACKRDYCTQIGRLERLSTQRAQYCRSAC